MGFRGINCSSSKSKCCDVVAECVQLMNSTVSFQPYPHDKKIRLALSHHLKVPLNLTLQRGLCDISCEGGITNSCETLTDDYYWENVSYPFNFENCTPLYHYCVSATIGDCCPVCTETIFMEDYQPTPLTTTIPTPWIVTVAALALLILFVGFLAFIFKNYVLGSKTSSHWQHKVVHVPVKYKNLNFESRRGETTVVFLYIREESQSFLDGVSCVQTFVKSKGLNVIDIYNEEEAINQSPQKWVHNVIENQNTKIVVLDTDLFRALWNYDSARSMILRPIELAILYIRSCISLTSLHTKLFIVRFQERDISTEGFIELGDGRCYMYPINRERLVGDLMNIQM